MRVSTLTWTTLILRMDDIHRLLAHNEATDEVADGLQRAVYDSRLWVLSDGGNPLEPEDWVCRRIWLSCAGRLWYENLEEGRPAQFFPEADVGSLQVSRVMAGVEAARTIGGQPAYVFRLQLPEATEHINGSSEGAAKRTIGLAAFTRQLRETWIAQIEAFRGTGGK